MGPRGEKKKKKKDALKKVTREILHSPENSPKAKTTRYGHEGKASRLDLSHRLFNGRPQSCQLDMQFTRSRGLLFVEKDSPENPT
ncbi:hypothetical protein NC653_010746 [Populus alba x Populus x berolinensis]|uniref:Uncharacterized protein n=1 Tax=Populus alba x Populus x berolinensis TaxID=444605 RepID=A0AAD6R1U5_9ROSI|nr:hypothetical protein NC653_010746 [Populus alba x Populus x berolinensis]